MSSDHQAVEIARLKRLLDKYDSNGTPLKSGKKGSVKNPGKKGSVKNSRSKTSEQVVSLGSVTQDSSLNGTHDTENSVISAMNSGKRTEKGLTDGQEDVSLGSAALRSAKRVSSQIRSKRDSAEESNQQRPKRPKRGSVRARAMTTESIENELSDTGLSVEGSDSN
jgi:hypothetical protein